MPLLQVFPFEQQQREATRLGFRLQIKVDGAERVVRARLLPFTDRAREAVKRASEDERATGIEAGATYEVLESPMDKLHDVIDHVLEVAKQTV